MDCLSHPLRLSQELELKQHSLGLLKERMAGSESSQLAEAVAATKADLEAALAAVGDAQEKKKAMLSTAKVGRRCDAAPSCLRLAGVRCRRV